MLVANQRGQEVGLNDTHALRSYLQIIRFGNEVQQVQRQMIQEVQARIGEIAVQLERRVPIPYAKTGKLTRESARKGA